jgi:tetratricopeptide (TPR) repeat protein
LNFRLQASHRQDVKTMDALSWALYRNGQYEQALEANAKALRLGTRDALFYYHAGLIQQKLRHPEQAADDLHTAFRINPSFDLIRAEEARSVLSAIEQGPSSEPSR